MKDQATPAPPEAPLSHLDTVWFQVAGTLCNLACSHCLVSASPTNETHGMLSLESVRRHLSRARSLGVRAYYFTGGEPFLNPELEAILEETLRQGPATVLTNGLTLDPARCARLSAMARAADYSLDIRVSIDGYDADDNDAIRGAGTYRRILRGIANLSTAGLNPILTVTEVCSGAGNNAGRERLLGLLREQGVAKPRLKILPVFRIGAEAERGGAYRDWQRLRREDAERWDHLQCSDSRMVTSRGVWVCPILVNDPAARMGADLADALRPYPLAHQACWTCHVEGATCAT